MHKEELTDGQSLRGFALATIAFLAIFAATAIPIPLYADYQATIGLTTADISNTMFAYLTGVALTLLLAGRISDAFGRTPVTSLTLMLAIVGCIMFMMADSGAAVARRPLRPGPLGRLRHERRVRPRHRLRGGETPRLGVHRGQLRRHGGHHDRVGGRGHPLRHRAEHRRALRHHDRHPGRVPVPHARGARAPRPDALAARRHEGARLHPHRQPASVRRGGRVLPGHLGSSPASTSRSRRPSPSSASARPRLWPGRSFWPSSWRRRSLAARSCSASSPSAPSSSPWRP